MKNKYLINFENERIVTVEDILNDIRENNRLYRLYSNKIIDYALYRGLNLISSYTGYNTDLTYNSDIKYTKKELYKHLKSNVMLWLRRSNIILKYDTLKKIIQCIKLVTNNDNKRGNSLKQYYRNKYNYVPRQRVSNYNMAVVS